MMLPTGWQVYLVGYKPDRTLMTFRREYFIYMTTTVTALLLITLLIFRLQKRSAALARERRNLQITSDTLAEGVFCHGPGRDDSPCQSRGDQNAGV